MRIFLLYIYIGLAFIQSLNALQISDDNHLVYKNYFRNLAKIAYGEHVTLDFHKDECAAEGLQLSENYLWPVVYDWGSSGVRFTVFEINLENKQVANEVFSVALGFPPHFGKKDLEHITNAWRTIIFTLEALFHSENGLLHRGIATAGLRSSSIGVDLIENIRALGVDMRIIDQSEEASLALEALYFKKPFVQDETLIVWDIGGKSMQWLLKDTVDDIKTLGSDGGLFHLQNYWAKMGGDEIDDREKYAYAYYVAKKFFFEGDLHLGASGLTVVGCRQISQKLPSAIIYGVGAIHSLYAHHFVETILDICVEAYNCDQLKDIINKILFMDDNQVVQLAHYATYNNSKRDILLKLIFVLAIMEHLGIENVVPVNVDNREGVMRKILSEID